VARLVARSRHGPLEPENGLIVASQLDQIRTNIVVRVAEVRVHADGAFAFCNGVMHFPLKVVGPTQKRVRFGGRANFQRISIEFDGAIQLTFHLGLIGLLK
jgi:hypothetical protein